MIPAMLPVKGRLDDRGRLVAADPMLEDLQNRAGGAVPGPICIPQIEAVAQLSLRLRAPVRQAIVAADGEDDLSLEVEARPEKEGVDLLITAWGRRDAYSPVSHAPAPPMDEEGHLHWEMDADLRLVKVTPFVAGLRLRDPLTASWRLVEDSNGSLPLLQALASRTPFSDQAAELRTSGERYILAGEPQFVHGVFQGYQGSAQMSSRAGDPLPPIVPETLEYALREPLESILVDAELLAQESEGSLEGRHVGYARDILTAGRHLKALIEDAMHLQAIEQPDFTVSLSPTDLSMVAVEASAMVAPQAAAAGVLLIAPEEGRTCAALGDHRRVLEIAVNLLSNAIRYAPKGSNVILTTERREAEAALVVKDHGFGIDPADHERIFDKYQRVDPSEPGGSGLGLYIARRLARAMGGDVTVESSPGDGAAFILSLPRG